MEARTLKRKGEFEEEHQKQVLELTPPYPLYHNNVWKFLFSNSSDNLMVHELEHARRFKVRFISMLDSREKQESVYHAGSHDSITLKLAPVLPINTYSFDEGALTVYKLMLSKGLLQYFHRLLFSIKKLIEYL